MDALFIPLASSLNASVGQIKCISCLLIAYPLGSLFIRIPSSQPNLKHCFNILVSSFFLIPVLNLSCGFLQLLGSIIGTYFIVANMKGPNMPWIVFAFAMSHLLINHIMRALSGVSYETVDISGPQLVLVMKLTTFAWNVSDGRTDPKDLDKWQLQKRVIKYPTLLEFLGYSFYFPGLLVGPYLDYASYMSLIDESLFKPAGGKGNNNSRRSIPDGRKRVAYRKLLTGLVFLGIFVIFIPSFYYGITITPWFKTRGFFYRVAYLQFCGFIERSRFYAVWTLTEGASILTGLGFSGYGQSGESTWEGAANVKVLEIELPSNFKVVLDSWNINTNIWLRECIYKRVTPKGKKPGFRSSMLTFATSAIWHGIAIGYYITFLFGGFVTTAGRLCRANLRPLVLPPPGIPMTMTKRIYDWTGTLLCILILNYTTVPFMVLTFTDSIEAWRILHWYGFWIVGSALAFFWLGGSRFLKALQKKEGKVAEKFATPESHVMPPPLDDVAEELRNYKKKTYAQPASGLEL